MSREWYKLTAHALREAVRNGETTAVEATQSYLDRIKAVDGKVQAYIDVWKPTPCSRPKSRRQTETGRGRRPPGRVPIG